MSTTATHERKAFQSVQHRPPARGDMSGALTFGFSWLLVMAIGLAPLTEASLSRSPSITMPTTVAFFVAVGSAVLLRRRYSWTGLVLHIFWPDRDLAFSVRHVARDCARRGLARMVLKKLP